MSKADRLRRELDDLLAGERDEWSARSVVELARTWLRRNSEAMERRDVWARRGRERDAFAAWVALWLRVVSFGPPFIAGRVEVLIHPGQWVERERLELIERLVSRALLFGEEVLDGRA